MKRELLALLAPVLIVIVLPAVDLMTRNHEALGLQVSMLTSLAAIGLAMVSAGVMFAYFHSRHWLVGYFYALFLLTAPGWVAYIITAAYLGKGLAFSAMLIVMPITAIVITRSRANLLDHLAQGCAIFSILLVVLAAVNAIQLLKFAHEKPQTERQAVAKNPDKDLPKAAAAELPDVYHVILDEFQTEMFEVALTNEQSAELGGFTFFPNASTPYGRTDMALGAIFSGRPYTYDSEPYDYIRDAFHGEQSLMTQFRKYGYYTTGLIPGIYPRHAPSPFDSTFIQNAYANYSGGDELSNLLLSVWLVASFPRYIVDRILPPSRLELLDSQTLLPASNPFKSVLSLRRFLREDLTPHQGVPQYLLLHLIVPHRPMVLDEDCNFQPDGSTAEMQSTCAVNLIIELMDRLKRENRFKNSLIVIHGDHGSSYSYDGTSLVEWGLKDLEWNKARSRPMLMVKPAGVPDSRPFHIDRRQTDLYDIYPTILDSIAVDATDRELVGQSLFHPEPQDRIRYYHFYQKDSKNKKKMIAGDIARYIVTPDGVEFDRNVPIIR